jgi:hypothetical protein
MQAAAAADSGDLTSAAGGSSSDYALASDWGDEKAAEPARRPHAECRRTPYECRCRAACLFELVLMWVMGVCLEQFLL